MNGTGRHAIEWVGAVVAVILTAAFSFGFLFGLIRPVAGANGVDGQMVKEVLLFVLGTVLGAAAVKGATAAASPSAGPGAVAATTPATEVKP